mgnify:CR=1 FL=1
MGRTAKAKVVQHAYKPVGNVGEDDIAIVSSGENLASFGPDKKFKEF